MTRVRLPNKTGFVDTDELTDRIGMAAVQVKTAQDLLIHLIRKAHGEGMSLRAIADAAGISHEQVRRIVSVDP